MISALKVGIIGCGARGLSVLERICTLAASKPELQIDIDIFDPSQPTGCGIHHVGQPDYLLLNTVASQLGAYPDAASLASNAGAEARHGPDFLTWCHNQDIRIDASNSSISANGRKVQGDDFLPRRLLGRYLNDVFRSIVSELPANVSVAVYPEYVTSIECEANSSNRLAKGFELQLASGDRKSVHQLVLTVGHKNHASGAQTLNSHRIFNLPKSLDDVKPGQPVLVEGLGLSAMDMLAALSTGRGGTFSQTENGHCQYFPSGREPQIFMQSRDGLPFCTRPDGLSKARRHTAIVLTQRRIDALRATRKDGRLDFEQHILPLMELEMRAAATALLAGSHDPTKRDKLLDELRSLTSSGAESGVEKCEAFLTLCEASFGGILVEDIIQHELPQYLEQNAYHEWLFQRITDDVRQSRKGLGSSAIKVAAEVWRDLRDVLRNAVDFDGLTDSSHRQFYKKWQRTINRLVAGPQKERHEDLLALCDVGLVTFLHPSSAPLHRDCIRIAARAPSTGIIGSSSGVIKSLHDKGLLRAKIASPGLDGLDVNRNCNPLSRSGDPVESIFVLGPVVEGSTYYNHYVSSAGAPSRLFSDAHRVAVALCDNASKRQDGEMLPSDQYSQSVCQTSIVAADLLQINGDAHSKSQSMDN